MEKIKETQIMTTAVVAVIISVIAIAFVFVFKPTLTIDAGAVGSNELANNSVTGDKIVDGAITDADIISQGISRIADGAVTLAKLAADVIITLENIADNSITSAKIADGTITDADISAGANIDPSKISGTAWTSTNDGSGSGLDADTVDGLHGTQFLRNDTSGTISGNLTVNGSITHQTENRYYTIPFSAFVGLTHTTPYSYSSSVLTNADGGFAAHNYYAPVNLPDGATITKVTVRYYRPDAAASAWAYLEKLGTAVSTVATISLPQNAEMTNYETAVTETVVSNNNAYWVRVNLDPNDSQWDIQLSWVCIAYTVTKPLP